VGWYNRSLEVYAYKVIAVEIMVERPIKKSERLANAEAGESTPEVSKPESSKPRPGKKDDRGKGKGKGKGDREDRKPPANPALMRGPKPTPPKPVEEAPPEPEIVAEEVVEAPAEPEVVAEEAVEAPAEPEVVAEEAVEAPAEPAATAEEAAEAPAEEATTEEAPAEEASAVGAEA
jgi:hypothetical protein